MKIISLILILCLLLIIICVSKENFSYGYGKSFGFFYHPQRCDPSNNCFPGTYLRSQQYHNVCSPKYGKLNREKIQLQDDCQRNLGNFPPERWKFNEHLQRQCRWKKKY